MARALVNPGEPRIFTSSSRKVVATAEELYETAKSFEELLNIHIKMFKGEIPTDNELEADSKLFVDKLIKLHQLHIFTVEGQGGESGCIVNPPTKDFPYYEEHIQKPYIDFYMKKTVLLNYLIENLMTNPKLKGVISDKDKILTTNLDKNEEYNVTMQRVAKTKKELSTTPWSIRSGSKPTNGYPFNVYDKPFLKNNPHFVNVFLSYDDFCSDFSLEDFLIQMITKRS